MKIYTTVISSLIFLSLIFVLGLSQHALAGHVPCDAGANLSYVQTVADIANGTLIVKFTPDLGANTVTGAINNTTDCSVPLSLASYKMFGPYDKGTLATQEFFDGSPTITVAPHSTNSLTVRLPTCMAQYDMWYGDVHHQLVNNEVYGAFVIGGFVHEGQYCTHPAPPPAVVPVPVTPPATPPPAVTVTSVPTPPVPPPATAPVIVKTPPVPVKAAPVAPTIVAVTPPPAPAPKVPPIVAPVAAPIVAVAVVAPVVVPVVTPVATSTPVPPPAAAIPAPAPVPAPGGTGGGSSGPETHYYQAPAVSYPLGNGPPPPVPLVAPVLAVTPVVSTTTSVQPTQVMPHLPQTGFDPNSQSLPWQLPFTLLTILALTSGLLYNKRVFQR